MLRLIWFLIGSSAIVGATGGAYLASTQGWGLSGALEEPVSVRQGSSDWRHRRSGVGFIYFGSTRRHTGGGFSGGK